MSKPTPTPRLTDPQLNELRKLAKEPQPTYGASRARVQNTLVRLNFAKFDEFANGLIVPFGDRCVITEAGNAFLLSLDKRKAPAQKNVRINDKALRELAETGTVNGLNVPNATGVQRLALDLQEARAQLAASEEVQPLKAKLARLSEMIKNIVPYVTSTIDPMGGNIFKIERLIGANDPTNTRDWVAVHAGRAGSSTRLLNALLKTAEEFEAGHH